MLNYPGIENEISDIVFFALENAKSVLDDNIAYNDFDGLASSCLERHIWTDFFNQCETDYRISYSRGSLYDIEGYILATNLDWNQFMAMADFVLSYLKSVSQPAYDRFVSDLEKGFERLGCGYVIVDNHIIFL